MISIIGGVDMVKQRRIKASLVVVIYFVILMFTIFPSNSYADELYNLFGQETFRTYQTIDEISSRMLNVCNKHQLKYFSILSKWEVYSVSDQEMLEDIKEYIDMVVKDLEFILEYKDTEIGKLFIQQFKNYKSDLTQLEKNPNLFFDNKVIFFNYAMNNSDLAIWYDYYTLFKENTIIPFADQYIYTNNTRINVKKIREGNDKEKQEGKKELKELISILENYRKSNSTPNIIKGYCKEAISHFNRVINGEKSDISSFVKGDRYWVEGLIQVGQEFDKMQEFNFYVMKFSDFSDYPTLELARKLDAEDLNNAITMLQSVPASSREIIELKRKHYDFICSLANEKNQKTISSSTEKLYVDFVNYYRYLSLYFSKLQEQYGVGFSSNSVVNEIEAYKSRLSCLDTEIDKFYTDISYKPVYVEDTTEYRNLAIANPKNWTKIISRILIGIFTVVFVTVVYKAIKNRNENEYYDDYY